MTTRPISRRGVLALGGVASLASALTACSTAVQPSGNSSAGASGEAAAMVLWTWPEGFAQQVLDSVKTKFPDIALRQDVIGGDFKQKLSVTLQGKETKPSITGVKGEDIAFFAAQADYFVDLNTLGAADRKGDFLDWKWAQATTEDGRQLGIPIDIGPTALFYRFDIFEKLGLPFEPDKLEAAIRSWDEYFNLGVEMKGKDAETFLIRNISGLFDIMVLQSGMNYIDKSHKFIGGESHIREAWDRAVKAHTLGISAALTSNSPDSTAAVAAGKLPADFGASWHLADLMVDAPDTSGKWHVCKHPGEATNNGGSFLAIPAGTPDAAKAFEVILHILNAENQIIEYTDKGNFPANSAAFASDALKAPVEFLGGQAAGELFAKAAETVRPLYEHPANNAVGGPFGAELELVEASGKDPEQAWNDAVEAAKRLAEQEGLSV
ncbi:MAG: extracellular solute-binding protein [Propionibacteriaceae bacterium]|nr:extracellular solute-binding protein [Propionibacteriaceae bacterium]